MVSYEVAKKYVERGFSVFPVSLSIDDRGKVQKRPAGKWEEFTHRLPTDEELHGWFDKGKFNGIGMATGKVSGMVVIDVESYATPDTLNTFDSPLISRTISGGYHFFYKWKNEIRNTVKIGGEAVDFRGDGGYVVLPPSGVSGRKYSWHPEKHDLEGVFHLPKEIEKELTTKKEASPIIRTDVPNEMGIPFEPAGEGGRNHAAAKVAGILLASIPRNLWNSAAWLSLVAWNNTNSPPLDEKELKITFESVKKIDLKQYQVEALRNDDAQYKIMGGAESVSEYLKMQEKYGLGLTTGSPTLDKYFTFQPEQLYLIGAPTHVGKTTWALNLCGKVAELGHKVLFASLEQGVFIVPRIRSIIGTVPEDFYTLTTNSMPSIEGLTALIEAMEEKPELICIDHLHFLKRGSRGITEEIDDAILRTQALARKSQVPVIVIAHMRKLNQGAQAYKKDAADKIPGLDDLRDSSSLSQVPAVVMLLHRAQNDVDNLQESYLSTSGKLVIAKNRIQGKTGVLNYEIHPNGKMILDKDIGKTEIRKPSSKPTLVDEYHVPEFQE